jgi:hypothetical protein
MSLVRYEPNVTALFKAVTTSQNKGAYGAGVTVTEEGTSRIHQTVLKINTVLPNIAGGASLGVGNLIYTFPAGNIIVDSAYMSMAITQTTGHINANTPTVGVGTVIASGAVSVLSGTATFQNILVGTAAANCTGTPTVLTAIPTANVPFVIAAASAHTIYFNTAAAWAASGDPAAILTGTIIINWEFFA